MSHDPLRPIRDAFDADERLRAEAARHQFGAAVAAKLLPLVELIDSGIRRFPRLYRWLSQ